MTLNFVPNTDKMKSSNRELKLKVMDDKAPVSSIGLLDKRLFKGDNSLWAVLDPHYGFWSFRFTHGQVPIELQNNWTTFQNALKDAKTYFAGRNVEIYEIVD